MKRFSSIRALLTATTVAFIALLAGIFTFSANTALVRSRDATDVLRAIQLKRQLFSAWECLRTELGEERAAYAAHVAVSPETNTKIKNLNRACQTDLNRAVTLLGSYYSSHPAQIAALNSSLSIYQKGFPNVIEAINKPAHMRVSSGERSWANTVDALTKVIDARSQLLTNQLEADRYTRKLLAAADTGSSMRASAGLGRRYLGDAFAQIRPKEEAFLLVAKESGRVDALWEQLDGLAEGNDFPPLLKSKIVEARELYFRQFRPWQDGVIARSEAGVPVSLSRAELLKISHPGIDSIYLLSRTALDVTEEYAQSQAIRSKVALRLSLIAMVVLTAVAIGVGGYIISRVVWPLTRITSRLRAVASGELDVEIPYKGRSDEIGRLAHSLQLFRESALNSKKVAEELNENQTAREVAEKANRAKSEFLANMSHELRTPLNAILGFSEIIKVQLFGPGDPRYQSYAQDIHGAGAHLLSLINDILDISKAEAGKVELHREVVNLEDLLKECMRLVRVRAEEKGLRLRLASISTLNLSVDRVRTKQMILNLLSNAIKFSAEGGVVSLEAGLKGTGIIEVACTDQGIGIPADQIGSVFEPFKQVDTALARKYEGTGLGLALVKQFVELHGGTVSLDSKEGEGTRVTITFPQDCLITKAVA